MPGSPSTPLQAPSHVDLARALGAGWSGATAQPVSASREHTAVRQ